LKIKISFLSFVFVGLILCSSFGVIGNNTAVGTGNSCGCSVIYSNKEKATGNTESREYALGLIMDYDEEGHLFPNPVTLSADSPSSWDWRNTEYNSIVGDWTTSIKDQANCGSCWAFGVIAAFESIYNIQKGDPDEDIDLSEQLLVSCGMTYYPLYINGCCGGSLYYAVKLLSWYGTVTESCFPYRAIDASGRDYQDCSPGDTPNNDPVKCSDKCDEWQDQVVKVKQFSGLADPESIKNAICNYGPVAAGFMVYEDFLDYDCGVYEQRSTKEVGGHVIAIVGYDDDQQCWICKNSWGTGWGETKEGTPNNGNDGGWFRIKYGECYIDSPGSSVFINGFTKSKTHQKLLPFRLIQNPFIEYLLRLQFFKNRIV